MMYIENHPDIKHLIVSNGISAFMDHKSETLIVLHSGNLHSCIYPVTLVT